MMVRIRTRVLAVVLAGVLAGVAALSGCSASQAQGEDNAITVAQPMDLKSPNPVIDNSLYSTNIFRAVFDQLTEVRADGTLGPRLATDWHANADATSWTFQLRDDATFHDGTPVTAADVVFSFREVMNDPASLNKIYTTQIASVEETSPTEVRFSLKAADAAFPRLAYYISVVPQEYYEKVGSQGFAKEPIGSGPYRFVSWKPGVATVLRAFPEYWRGAPSIKDVTVQPVADPEARLNGVLAGDIDLTAVNPAQYGSVVGIAEPVEAQSNQLIYLAAQAETGPLEDENLRKAISLAVDRHAIMEMVLDGHATAASASSVAPDVEGYDGSLPTLSHDLKRAKKLVEDSDYDGQTIPLDYPTDGNVPMSDLVAQALGDMLGKAGIKVALRGSDAESFDLKWTKKEFKGLYLSQFSPSMMDASTTMNYLFGPTGNALFSDPEINDLMVQASSTLDYNERRAVISKVWQRNEQRAWVVNLGYTVGTYGKAKELNWQPRADGHVDWRTASWE